MSASPKSSEVRKSPRLHTPDVPPEPPRVLPVHWPEDQPLEDRFLTTIKDFLELRFKDGTIPIVRSLLGGWESWLQIEMALKFLEVFRADKAYDVERETTVWASSATGTGLGKCDLWFHPTKTAPKGSQAYVIELKTDIDRAGPPSGWKKIRDSFKIDVEKVGRGLVEPEFVEGAKENKMDVSTKEEKHAKPPELKKGKKKEAAWERARDAGGHKIFCIAITSFDKVVTKADTEWVEIQQKGTAYWTYIAQPPEPVSPLIMIWYQEGVRASAKMAVDSETESDSNTHNLSGKKRTTTETKAKDADKTKVSKKTVGPEKPFKSQL